MENGRILTKRVMRRIYAVWILRQAIPTLTAAPLSAGVALWLTAKEFFVARIMENFIVSFHSGKAFSFVSSAFYNSNHLLSVAAVGFLSVLFLILSYRLFRNFIQLSLVKI